MIAHKEDDGLIISKAEPHAWLERLGAFRGDHWKGYAETLQRDRDEWDQRY